MSEPSHRSQSPRSQQGEASSSSRAAPSRQSRPPLPHARYPGDGFDFRRPVMSHTPRDSVIDLTEEPDSSPHTRSHSHTNADTDTQAQLRRSSSGTTPRNARPPRFGRNILAEPDVVDLVDEPDENVGSPSSPEVQFVGSNIRLPPPRPPTHRSLINPVNLFHRAVSMRARVDPSRPLDLSRLFGTSGFDIDRVWLGNRVGDAADQELEIVTPDPTAATARRPDSYKAPSPPPEGFTRKVDEDEAVICPNCETELGTGDDIQRQIWVAKQCGHVRILFIFKTLY